MSSRAMEEAQWAQVRRNDVQLQDKTKTVYLSKMYYGIEVWGAGLTKVQIRQLQACQNMLVAWVDGQKIIYNTKGNLKQCGLLSINQIISFKTIILGLKVLREKKPEGILKRITRQKNENIRQSVRLEGRGLREAQSGFYKKMWWSNLFLRLQKNLPDEFFEREHQSRR